MPNARSETVAAAIIAGGSARRFGGIDKTALTIAGRSILDRQLEVLAPRFSRVLLVTGPNPPSPHPAPATTMAVAPVTDRGVAGRGPLAGIDAALAALLPHESAVVCVAGDMPLLQPRLLELLRDHSPDAEAVVPRLGPDLRPEPLFARYGRNCAPAITAALESGAFKASALLRRLPVTWLDEPTLRALDPDLLSFENANTPADLARITTLVTRRDG